MSASKAPGHWATSGLACGYALGDVLAHWDDDDWSADWRLAYQMEALSNNEWASLCGIARVLF